MEATVGSSYLELLAFQDTHTVCVLLDAAVGRVQPGLDVVPQHYLRPVGFHSFLEYRAVQVSLTVEVDGRRQGGYLLVEVLAYLQLVKNETMITEV